LVIFDNEHDGECRTLALDAGTGKVRWETPRKTKMAAYGTPCVYEPEGQKPQLVITSQAHGIFALDPSTGQPLWEYDKAFDKRSVSSPVLADGVILGSCGSGAGGSYVVAVRPPDSSTDKPELAYEVRKSAPYVPTSVAVGKRAFLWSDGGIVTCVQAATGKIHWQERVGGNYFASPIAFGDRVLNVSTTGEVVMIKVSDQFEVLARNNLDELCHTTPAVAGGRLYVRTASRLYSIGGADAATVDPPSGGVGPRVDSTMLPSTPALWLASIGSVRCARGQMKSCVLPFWPEWWLCHRCPPSLGVPRPARVEKLVQPATAPG
jgi:outer membrane protein assembly factor BamB